MKQPAIERTIAYIDGFNLYFGLRESGLRRCYWLDVKALAAGLLRARQRLVVVKYFTARISGWRASHPVEQNRYLEERRKRQAKFLDALGTLTDLTIYEGHFLGKDVQCRSCGAVWRTHEEKMTDVQIATQMLTDAFTDRFDTALLVSGDSDLVPPTLAVRRHFRDKRVVVAFPPGRSSVDLKRAANASFSRFSVNRNSPTRSSHLMGMF